MIRGKQTTAVALVGAVALASGAYALGTQSDGSANAADKANSPQPYGYGGVPRPGGLRLQGIRPGFDQLADKLGVSEDDLRAALEDIRADHDELRDEFASELADALGIDQSKVTAALDKVRPDPPDRPARPHLRAPTEIASALAKELGLSSDKVRSALEQQRGGFHAPGDLAKALGVSEDKLRAAFEKVLGDFRPHPPGRPGFGNLAKELGVTQAKLEAALEKIRDAHKDDLAQALADRLKIDVAKVKDALDDLGPFGFGRHHP
jgi:biotin operon repressor